MIQAIDKKYCIENLVQLMPPRGSSQLIVCADEIILLKVGDKVLVNKYTNHPSRSLFPNNEKEMPYSNHFTELFEYNKTYLNFMGSGGFSFHKYYFFKGSERALWVNESLSVDERNAKENSVELNRQEIEELFNSRNYDSMYVMNSNGFISFARSKKDKIHIGKNIIPSDNEIVKRELNKRKMYYSIGKAINFLANDNKETAKSPIIPKTINEIKNFKIIGPVLFANYSDMLLTIKDGKFDLKWFRIDFIEKDKFRLTSSPIKIVEPTVDDVLHYSNKYEIESTPEPSKPIPSFKQVHTPKNQKMAMNTINSIIDGEDQQEPDKPQKGENGVYKKLRKLFKNNSTGSN